MVFILISCESLDSDNALLPTQAEEQTTYVSAASATVIDLLSNNGSGEADADISITREPSKGIVKLLASGQAVYIPHANVSTGKDLFQYVITQNNKVDSGQVDIDIVKDSSDLPCTNLILADIVYLDPQSIVTTGKDIDVLANDAFCNGNIDYNSLEIIANPLYGSAQVSQNGYITYFGGNIPSSADYDVFVYKVTTIGSNPIVGYAPVIIYFTSDSCTTLPKANDYHLRMPNSPGINNSSMHKDFFPTLNDIFCESTLDRSSFKIIQEPNHGIASGISPVFVYWPSGDGYYGIDSFVYQFCDKFQNCTSATIYVHLVDDIQRCWSTPLPDKITLAISSANNIMSSLTQAEKQSLQLSGTETVIELDVTANDVICSGGLLEIISPIVDQTQGRIAIVQNKAVYIHDGSFFGNTEFHYSVSQYGQTNWKTKVSLKILP